MTTRHRTPAGHLTALIDSGHQAMGPDASAADVRELARTSLFIDVPVQHWPLLRGPLETLAVEFARAHQCEVSARAFPSYEILVYYSGEDCRDLAERLRTCIRLFVECYAPLKVVVA